MSLVHFNNINTIKICVANNYLKHWKPILPVWAIESRERLNTKIDGLDPTMLNNLQNMQQ